MGGLTNQLSKELPKPAGVVHGGKDILSYSRRSALSLAMKVERQLHSHRAKYPLAYA